jgi:Flp pilus assembly pilin Flp
MLLDHSPELPFEIGCFAIRTTFLVRENCAISFLKRLHKDESGQDLVEYALIVALGALAGMGTVASSLNAEFSKIAFKLS